jgi:hypothetical protein
MSSEPNVLLAKFHPLADRIDSEIAIRIQKTDQPVSDAQAAAPQIQHDRFRIQSCLEQADELPPPGKIKGFDRHSQKAVLADHLLAAVLNSRSGHDGSIQLAVVVPRGV